MLIAHLFAGRCNSLYFVCCELNSLYGILQILISRKPRFYREFWTTHSGRSNSSATHDLNKIGATSKLFARCFQDFGDTVTGTTQKCGVPSTAFSRMLD